MGTLGHCCARLLKALQSSPQLSLFLVLTISPISVPLPELCPTEGGDTEGAPKCPPAWITFMGKSYETVLIHDFSYFS